VIDQDQVLSQVLDAIDGRCTAAELIGIACALLAVGLSRNHDSEGILEILEAAARVASKPRRQLLAKAAIAASSPGKPRIGVRLINVSTAKRSMSGTAMLMNRASC
jgi:hypothetical protein